MYYQVASVLLCYSPCSINLVKIASYLTIWSISLSTNSTLFLLFHPSLQLNCVLFYYWGGGGGGGGGGVFSKIAHN